MRTTMKDARTLRRIVIVAVLAAGAADAATMEMPMLDPWLPPTLRKAAPQPPPHGGTLKAQVERKLRAGFDAADIEHAGSVTLAQARAAGLGYVANNFARIDAAGAGRVSFDDVKRYLREQGADL